MATTNPSSTAKTKANRLPAPALFVGPPSRNASNLSVARAPSTAPTGPVAAVKFNSVAGGGAALQSSQPPSPRQAAIKSSGPANTRQTATPPLTPRQNATHPPHQPQSILDLTRQSPTTAQPRPTSKSSLDAQWAELQRTLNEVEAAAPSSITGGDAEGKGGRSGGETWTAGATVFGTRHAAALTRLRNAQISLAMAWGPLSGGDDGGVEEASHEANKDADAARQAKEEEGKRATAHPEERDGSDGQKAKQDRRQRDGELDLKIAAERREKNGEYFAKVRAGLQDVVGKLAEVSNAMKQVEGEGREIWDDSSIGTASGEDAGSVVA